MKQHLLQKRRRRLYEAYLWEGRRNSWDEEDDSSSIVRRRELFHEIDQLREEYEGRLFEDPLYLMQYTLAWDDTNVGALQESPENDAFINAENEIYLNKASSSWCICYRFMKFTKFT